MFVARGSTHVALSMSVARGSTHVALSVRLKPTRGAVSVRVCVALNPVQFLEAVQGPNIRTGIGMHQSRSHGAT